MPIKNIYPPRSEKKHTRREVIAFARWPFLLAAYACPIVNLCVGGQAWSVVVLWSLYLVWTAFFAPTLVEYNRISQFIRLILHSCILLILIYALLSGGAAKSLTVVPLVCFGGLVFSGILFFTNLTRQKHNMLPMLTMILIALIASIVGLCLWERFGGWEIILMGATALGLLLACISALGGDMLRELKKRLHTK